MSFQRGGSAEILRGISTEVTYIPRYRLDLSATVSVKEARVGLATELDFFLGLVVLFMSTTPVISHITSASEPTPLHASWKS